MANKLSKAFQVRRSNKYRAKRLELAGESYDSMLEHELHKNLMLMERAGLIKEIRRQQVIQLTRFVKWRADFVVFDIIRGIDIIIEAKGFEDLRWRVLKQLIPEFCPLPVQIWVKSGKRLVMKEEIIPLGFK